MKNLQSGVTTLIVLACMSFLMLYCIQLQRTVAYMNDICAERKQHERCVYAVRALAHYVCAVTQTYYDAVLRRLEQLKTVSVTLSPLPEPWRAEFSSASARIIWTGIPGAKINAQIELRCSDAQRAAIFCTLERKGNGTPEHPYTYHMSEWREQ